MLREYGILSDCARILGVISKKFIEEHRKSKEKNFVEEIEKAVKSIYNLLSKACFNSSENQLTIAHYFPSMA